MTELVKHSPKPVSQLTRRDPRRLKLFKETVGKDLNDGEVDQAIEWCEVFGANPFVKDIYFFVFDAKNEAKRRIVPVLGIGLYRKIADRTGNYRPDPAPPRFTYDEQLISKANPKGIVDCEVTVFKHVHGEWFPVTERLKWEERAPIVVQKWVGRYPDRKLVQLDEPEIEDGKDNWKRMPETMLSKCTEAAAIRKGWPEETAGGYLQEELDGGIVLDLTATEVVREYERAKAVAQIGVKDSQILVSWEPSLELEPVHKGVLADRIIEWVRSHDAPEVESFVVRNRVALRDLYALDKSAALVVKREIEAKTHG